MKTLTAFALLLVATRSGSAEEIRFQGAVIKGQLFRHLIHRGLLFGLDPTDLKQGCNGWRIWIGPSEDVRELADIATGPSHGFTSLDICAADFRNADNSGLNLPGPKNVNRPGRVREFWFLPSEQSQHAKKGRLQITRLALGQLGTGAQPTIERMEFVVELSFR